MKPMNSFASAVEHIEKETKRPKTVFGSYFLEIGQVIIARYLDGLLTEIGPSFGELKRMYQGRQFNWPVYMPKFILLLSFVCLTVAFSLF